LACAPVAAALLLGRPRPLDPPALGQPPVDDVRAAEGCYAGLRKGVTKVRQVILYLGEDGYWVVECPSLPGCISQGRTKEEAIANIKEAIRGYIGALEEDNLPVPAERFEAYVVAV
jgi:predicted RNase H-like HicB family nuclease